jgi:O-antigen/teichoic acid export membrane protein
MSTIRRQSIISSGIVYFGFALGALNTLLFAKSFTPEQYGLTGIFQSLAIIIFQMASLGMQAFIYKFYPYYHDNLPPKENDMMTWAFVISLIGFLVVITGGLFFKDFVLDRLGNNSPELVKYYYWIFPFGAGLTFYSLLETFAWHLKKVVLTSFFKEVQFRFFTFLLILISITGILKSFDTFIKIYAFTYLLLALCLFIYLTVTQDLHFPFRASRVSKKFFKKIITLASFVWSGQILISISTYFAQIILAFVIGMRAVGIYTLALYVGGLVQAIQRSVNAATVGPLSRAWKEKDYGRINRIYQRSSINQLIFSAGMFVLIWINFTDGVLAFHLKSDYLLAKAAFFYVGLKFVVDMGTGVNSQIIGASTFWRFDFFTGVILAALTLPTNYILAVKEGYVGPAMADLATFSLYNAIR